MKQETAKQAVLRKDRPAGAAFFHSSCDSVFAFSASFFQLPPHLLEAVFLCPASACEKAALVSHYNVL